MPQNKPSTIGSILGANAIILGICATLAKKVIAPCHGAPSGAAAAKLGGGADKFYSLGEKKCSFWHRTENKFWSGRPGSLFGYYFVFFALLIMMVVLFNLGVFGSLGPEDKENPPTTLMAKRLSLIPFTALILLAIFGVYGKVGSDDHFISEKRINFGIHSVGLQPRERPCSRWRCCPGYFRLTSMKKKRTTTQTTRARG